MIKKRTILLFIIIPLILGFFAAHLHQMSTVQNTTFVTGNIPPSDRITISSNGNIYQLTTDTTQHITNNQHLIEPAILGKDILGVSKQTNYASLILFDMSGNRIKTLVDGKSDVINSMVWVTDPAVHPSQDEVAYVSDQDRQQTGIPDNALFLFHIQSRTTTVLVKPAPYSGGIAHPVWNSKQPSMIIYDYYQYDPQTLTPYSTIQMYDITTQITTDLTTEKQNAYQGAFSPDGKQFLFLGRNVMTNNATLYIATLSNNKLSHIHPLLTGDLAYPVFSYTPSHIYFLQAQGNSSYNLMSATVTNNTLIHVSPVVNGYQLPGNSSYTVSNK